jgi:hypothetical protein
MARLPFQIVDYQVKGIPDKIITSLFADNTMVYLSENYSFDELQTVLDTWRHASGEELNVQKTIAIPVIASDHLTDP